jgi:hypothetical protein
VEDIRFGPFKFSAHNTRSYYRQQDLRVKRKGKGWIIPCAETMCQRFGRIAVTREQQPNLMASL